MNSYDDSVGKNQLAFEDRHLTNPITTLRPERGSLVANYDASVGQILKPLRRQFWTNYDHKKGRNK
jgi:hypothetical protein